MGRLILIAMMSRCRRQAPSRQEIVDGQVLVRAPPGRATPHARLVEGTSAIEEVLEGAPHRQVPRGADVAAAEMAREKPFRRPSAETAHGGERPDHLVVGVTLQRVQVHRFPGNPTSQGDHVLGLSRGELKPTQLGYARSGEAYTV